MMAYYQRPKLVRNALNSILKANENHEDWELCFWDDGSNVPGRPIVEEILKDHLHKVRFGVNDMTIDDKINTGLILGKMANEGIRETNAGVAIILCDDDELYPVYLKNLSDYFEKNPDVLYCYSKVYLFNPLVQKSEDVPQQALGKYNQWEGPIVPARKVDASQVAWRVKCCTEYGAWFKDTTQLTVQQPWCKDIDHSFFENLFEKCGLCHPTGFVAQYKGVHDQQLLWYKDGTEAILREYDQWCKNKGGEEF